LLWVAACFLIADLAFLAFAGPYAPGLGEEQVYLMLVLLLIRAGLLMVAGLHFSQLGAGFGLALALTALALIRVASRIDFDGGLISAEMLSPTVGFLGGAACSVWLGARYLRSPRRGVRPLPVDARGSWRREAGWLLAAVLGAWAVSQRNPFVHPPPRRYAQYAGGSHEWPYAMVALATLLAAARAAFVLARNLDRSQSDAALRLAVYAGMLMAVFWSAAFQGPWACRSMTPLIATVLVVAWIANILPMVAPVPSSVMQGSGQPRPANPAGDLPHFLDRVAYGMWVWLVTAFGCSALLATVLVTGLVSLGEDGVNFAFGALAVAAVSTIVALAAAVRMRRR
jgi:hypothetical protein